MFNPVIFNDNICNGCNHCVEICPMDIFAPNPEKGKPPIVKYPDECAYEGVCVERCPRDEVGAVVVTPPLPMRVSILRGSAPAGEIQ